MRSSLLKFRVWSAVAAAVILLPAPGLVGASLVAQAATPAETAADAAQDAGTETAPATVVEEVAILQTNLGDIVLRFFPDVAPNHVEAWKTKARDGVYNGTKFHRIIPGFMIQGGDPNSKDGNRANDGLGGVGPMLKAEFSTVPHRRGILSTARKPSGPNTATSQFFIMVRTNPGLDRQYTVFGQVVEGMDAVDRIVSLRRDRRDNPLPENPAVIQAVVFEEREIPARESWTYAR